MDLPQRFATIGRQATGAGSFHRIRKEDGEIRALRADVLLECTPLSRGEGLHFAAPAAGIGILADPWGAVIEGVRSAATHGLVRKLPLTDLRIVLLGGRFDPVESTPYACQMAGIFALLNAFERGGEVVVD